jgi:hypothetical protein
VTGFTRRNSEGNEEGSHGYNFDHHFTVDVNRCFANLALQHRVGLLSKRRLGTGSRHRGCAASYGETVSGCITGRKKPKNPAVFPGFVPSLETRTRVSGGPAHLVAPALCRSYPERDAFVKHRQHRDRGGAPADVAALVADCFDAEGCAVAVDLVEDCLFCSDRLSSYAPSLI